MEDYYWTVKRSPNSKNVKSKRHVSKYLSLSWMSSVASPPPAVVLWLDPLYFAVRGSVGEAVASRISILISRLSDVSDFCSGSGNDASESPPPPSSESIPLLHLSCIELEVDMAMSWPMLLDDVIEDVIEAEVRLEDDSLEQKLVFIMAGRLARTGRCFFFLLADRSSTLLERALLLRCLAVVADLSTTPAAN